MDRSTYCSPAVASALADWDAIEAEHDAEHFDDVVMDCPICVAEWNRLTAQTSAN